VANLVAKCGLACGACPWGPYPRKGWSFIQDTVFKILTEFGVSCRRNTLKGAKEEDLATGTGYLRSKGWVMKISFDEEIGGKAALKALKTYIQKIDEKYGKKAFQYYQDVDMRVLIET